VFLLLSFPSIVYSLSYPPFLLSFLPIFTPCHYVFSQVHSQISIPAPASPQLLRLICTAGTYT
jgi:hypothetical protein